MVYKNITNQHITKHNQHITKHHQSTLNTTNHLIIFITPSCLPPYVLHAELQKDNTEYKEKLEAGHASDQTMFSLSWDIEKLNRLNNEGRSLRTEISAAIDVCNPDTTEQHNLPRKLTSVRKRLSEFIRKVTRFRRKPATNIFVLMISSALRNQKPYALPVQCIPYAGIKEVDIRQLVSALVREMVSHGMNVAGKHCFVSLMFLLILVCYLV